MDNSNISIVLPIKRGLKSYILARTHNPEPFPLVKTDPVGFGLFVLNSLSGKRSCSGHHPDRYQLKRYDSELRLNISTSYADRNGLFLTNEKIKDINDFIAKTMLLEFHSFIFGAKQYHATIVEKYALEDYRDFLGIGEDDYHFESFLKEFSRKRKLYRPVV